MAKHRADITIGHRMHEEVVRVCADRNIRRDLFAPRSIRQPWREGCCPGGFYLQRLYYFGGDVMYVLTGKRSVKDG